MRIYPTHSSVRLTGRWDTTTENTAVTVNTGAYIEFAFVGKLATVLFDTQNNASPVLHLWISVDGEAMIETPIDAYLRINAHNDGTHVVKIIYKGGQEASSRWYAPCFRSGENAQAPYRADNPCRDRSWSPPACRKRIPQRICMAS